MDPKQEPAGPPRWAEAAWRLREAVTWPLTAIRLRRAGFTRTGWRTWAAGPPETGPPGDGGSLWDAGFADPPEPAPPCYRAAIGIMMHGPGCTCPP